jgi:hypothetical protein
MLIPAVLVAAALVAAVVLGRGGQLEQVMATGDMMGGVASEQWDPPECPGGMGYYTTQAQSRFRRRPTDAEMKATLANPPAANLSDVFKCSGDCINVCTHIWHSWYLNRNRLTRGWTLHVVTFSQFRCTSPGDPAVNQPPVMGHPTDPSRPLMA